TVRAIQRQAAEWLALRRAHAPTDTEAAAFAAWCAADPRHAEMLAEVEMADRIFDRLAFYPRPVEGPADHDLLNTWRRRSHAPAILALAAAAVIAGLFFMRASDSTRAVPATPAIAIAHFLRLPDGSRVELSSGSEVAEHFTVGERRIRLMRGEAHFEVAKNPLRPFIVEAGGVTVRAVGTAFDVRLDETAVHVLVTEGRVGVMAGTNPARLPTGGQPLRPSEIPAALGPGLILVAGQRAAIPMLPHTAEIPPLVVEVLTPRQIDRALAWQSSRFVFDATPLAEVVDRFNRLAVEQDGPGAVQLKVRGAGLAALRVSGRVSYDGMENFVDVLEADFGVIAERNGTEILLREAR
ncbi:MAG: FecR domain-containing protein, partial [Opitutaceae bacterium]